MKWGWIIFGAGLLLWWIGHRMSKSAPEPERDEAPQAECGFRRWATDREHREDLQARFGAIIESKRKLQVGPDYPDYEIEALMERMLCGDPEPCCVSPQVALLGASTRQQSVIRTGFLTPRVARLEWA